MSLDLPRWEATPQATGAQAGQEMEEARKAEEEEDREWVEAREAGRGEAAWTAALLGLERNWAGGRAPGAEVG